MLIYTDQHNNGLAQSSSTKPLLTVPKSKWAQTALKINNSVAPVFLITFKCIITVVIAVLSPLMSSSFSLNWCRASVQSVRVLFFLGSGFRSA